MEEASLETPTEFKNKLINEMLQKYRNKRLKNVMKEGILNLLYQNEDISPKITPIYTKIENNQLINNSKRIKQYDHKPSHKRLNLLHSYNSHSNILNKHYQTHYKVFSLNDRNGDSEYETSGLPRLFESNHLQEAVFTPKLRGFK